ncbi:MAG: hypothetical protein V7723_19650 [Sneathiella sp.]|uniref:hypothetical protein n=1 Tax=Sneathiella sp. TaxID=1964365 RepID=UPI003001460C
MRNKAYIEIPEQMRDACRKAVADKMGWDIANQLPKASLDLLAIKAINELEPEAGISEPYINTPRLSPATVNDYVKMPAGQIKASIAAQMHMLRGS